jgi:hypothetical protein
MIKISSIILRNPHWMSEKPSSESTIKKTRHSPDNPEARVWVSDPRAHHPKDMDLEVPFKMLGKHIQPPNPDTIAYARKILLRGPWYSYLLWGYASSWQMQTYMLTVIYWMEHRTPNEGARESTLGAKGVSNPIRGSTIWTNQYPQNCVSSCICSRGWRSWPSMGGEALGLEKIICLSTGEWQGWK